MHPSIMGETHHTAEAALTASQWDPIGSNEEFNSCSELNSSYNKLLTEKNSIKPKTQARINQ